MHLLALEQRPPEFLLHHVAMVRHPTFFVRPIVDLRSRHILTDFDDEITAAAIGSDGAERSRGVVITRHAAKALASAVLLAANKLLTAVFAAGRPAFALK